MHKRNDESRTEEPSLLHLQTAAAGCEPRAPNSSKLAAAPMENQQVEAPARAQRRRREEVAEVTPVDHFQAYKYKDLVRVGLPLPKKAPAYEATEYNFDKNRDATGSELADLLKRHIFGLQELMGNKRRQILQKLPVNDGNRKHVKTLGIELDGLEDELHQKIAKMERDTGITYDAPYYFAKFPALKN